MTPDPLAPARALTGDRFGGPAEYQRETLRVLLAIYDAIAERPAVAPAPEAEPGATAPPIKRGPGRPRKVTA